MEITEKFSKSMLRRNKGTPYQVQLPPRIKNMIIHNYLRTKSNYSNTLLTNMKTLQSGGLNKQDYLDKQQTTMKQVYADSFKLGKFFATNKYGDLSSDEKRFVGYQVSKEMDFMKKFTDNILSGTGKMPYSRRMKMYSDSLDAMFGFGRLTFLPDDVKIIWKLGATDKHCLDCLSFSANNPYTKRTLPGFPKSGASVCLSNCLCSLLYFYQNNAINSEYEQVLLSGKQFSKTKNIPTEEEFAYLKNLQDQYYYNISMFEISKDKKFKNEASILKSEFYRTKQNNDFYYPVDFNQRKMLLEIKSFNKNKKFINVQTSHSLSEGDFVSLFMGNQQLYSKVFKVFGEDIYIKTLEGMEYVINPNKNIVFKEI